MIKGKGFVQGLGMGERLRGDERMRRRDGTKVSPSSVGDTSYGTRDGHQDLGEAYPAAPTTRRWVIHPTRHMLLPLCYWHQAKPLVSTPKPPTYVSPRRKNPRKPTIIHAVGRSGQRRIDNGTKRASLIRTTPTSTQQRREDDAELTTCLKYGAPSVTGAAAHRRRLDLQRRKEALANGGHRAPGGGGLREELQGALGEGGPWGEARGVLPLPGFFHCFGPPGEEGQAGGGLFLEGGEDGSGTKELLWLGCL
ncbi:hypothetical protein BHE74_00004408 [Ensete ventricosum]|nr:hypothetical protein BHE74_00004408 [Ensete ventricosum]